MKKILMLTCVHGGAGTAAALLQYEDGIARGGAGAWTAPKDMAVTKMSIMGANAVGATMIRGGHTADNVTIPALADTLADVNKVVDFKDLLDGAGIDIKSGEVVNFQSIAGAATTTMLMVELDDSVPRVNVRAPRVAGAAAVAVALVPQETGANLRAALSTTSRYSLKAMFLTSTTIISVFHRWTKNPGATVQMTPGAGAIVSGLSNYSKIGTPLIGTGADFNTDYQLEILCTAVDAAAVQDIFAIFETN